MTNQEKAKILIIIALIGAVGLIWTICQDVLDKYYLSKEYRFTVSKINSYAATSKTGATKKYIFTVKSKTYTGFTHASLNSDSIYFIKYYPPNPEINEATLVIANEIDIKNLPIDGYKQLPHK